MSALTPAMVAYLVQFHPDEPDSPDPEAERLSPSEEDVVEALIQRGVGYWGAGYHDQDEYFRLTHLGRVAHRLAATIHRYGLIMNGSCFSAAG